MKLKLLSLFLAAAASSCFTGCSTPKVTASSSSDVGGVRTLGIDIGDCTMAAEDLVKKLFSSNALSTPGTSGGKALVSLSLVSNRTSVQGLNTRLITNKILDAIQQNGQADIIQNYDSITDPIGSGADDLNRLRNKEKRIRIPDLTLSGEIIETYAAAGRVREYNYHFHMVLAKGNNVVWQDQVEIRKQEKRSGLRL